MSDEFDKEAEREKLREKFADEEEKRSATQRMSELLLQGATMTNKHCGTCGDPLFRDNGQTFCPTCADAEGQQGETPEEDQPALESATETVNTGTPPRNANGARQQSDRAGDAEGLSQLPENAEVQPQPGGTPRTPERRPETGQSRSLPDEGGAPKPPESGDTVDDPRAELRRAVTETARKASAATDPRTARAWLEASKEAAEALAALE